MSQAIDLVLPFVHSRAEDVELRFALRSIERYGRGIRWIYVVGDDPGFLGEGAFYVPCPIFHNTPKDARIALQILWCFDRVPITSPACLWNDDFILLEEVDCRSIRPYHKGIKLEAAALKHKSKSYSATLQATATELLAHGYPTWHYDIHAPIHYQPDLFRIIWDWWTASARSPAGYVVKSVYQNIMGFERHARIMDDCKFNKFPGREEFDRLTAGRWIYSYGHITLRTGLLNYLNEIYPEKSRYER